MPRVEVLRDIAAQGRRYTPARLGELADELGLRHADLLVVARHPVPASMLPPERDPGVVRDFVDRVAHCDHAALVGLREFVESLPPSPGTLSPEAPPPAGTEPFWLLVAGLLRNRGLPAPSKGARSVAALCGLLGWAREDLAALADGATVEVDGPAPCHHVGEVYVAAIPLGTAELARAVREADRLGRSGGTCPG